MRFVGVALLGAAALCGCSRGGETVAAATPPCHDEGAAGPAVVEAKAAPAETEVELVDAALVERGGAKVRFAADVVGERITVMNFVYTSCRTVCPLLSGLFASVQDRLGDRVGADVGLVSVSLDPARDTPARLAEMAERHRAGEAWRWVTGTPEDVDRVLRGLGTWTADPASHPPVVLVGDPKAGRWFRFNGLPDAEAVVGRVEALLAAREVARAAEGRAKEYFTDTKLLDQAGREVAFYSDVLADRTVVMNFMFTRCKDACPLMTARLDALRKELGERFGRDVSFVSVSVDPADGPAELAAFARKHRVPHDGWTLLGGPRERIEAVVRRLGQWVEDPEAHGTVLLVGNTRTRHWTKLRSDLPTVALAEQVRRIADGPGK